MKQEDTALVVAVVAVTIVVEVVVVVVGRMNASYFEVVWGEMVVWEPNPENPRIRESEQDCAINREPAAIGRDGGEE